MSEDPDTFSEASSEPFQGTPRFQVVRRIGAGGMGTVYEAFDNERHNSVALKCIQRISAKALFQFKSEFRSLAEIVHPNLLALYELVHCEDHWFFTMELVEGGTHLLTYLRGTPSAAERGESAWVDQVEGYVTSCCSEADLANLANLTRRALHAPTLEARKVFLVEELRTQPTERMHMEGLIHLHAKLTSEGRALGHEMGTARSAGAASSGHQELFSGPAEADYPGYSTDAFFREALPTLETVFTTLCTTLSMQSGDRDLFRDANEAALGSGDRGGSSGCGPPMDPGAEGFQVVQVERDYPAIRDAFFQLAEGIHHLHQAGKLHRDLKPANVLVRPTGQVMVLDFGLVLEMDEQLPESISQSEGGSLVVTGSSVAPASRSAAGSLAYMSPEQAANSLSLDESTDWYAVGVMLFEAITGVRPIRGGPTEILVKKLKLDCPAPSELVAGVPEDLDQLCLGLLQRERRARPKGPEILRVLGAGVTPVRSIDATPGLTAQHRPFVGRKRHLVQLMTVFERMVDGKTVVVRVHGQSGMGKSVLIDRFFREVSSQGKAIVLKGRCYEQESVNFKAIDNLIDALISYLMCLSPEETSALLPPHIDALAQVFPVIRREPAIDERCGGEVVTHDLRELQRRAFRALRILLTRIGERHPLVLAIDDLQWGDLDSSRLLLALLAPPNPPRILLLFSYRSEYIASSPALEKLATLDTMPGISTDDGVLEVGPLSEVEARELAAAEFGARNSEVPNKLVEEVARQSAGNPFFIHALTRSLTLGSGDFGMAEIDLGAVLWNHVKRLPDVEQRLMKVIALTGQPTELRIVQEAAGVDVVPPKVLLSLRSAHLVGTTGPHLTDKIVTYHDRVRECITARLESAELQGIHRGLAEALRADRDAPHDLLARHFEGAGDLVEAASYYESAADFAVKSLAFDHADALYHKAEDTNQDRFKRARVREKLVHFYSNLARFDDAYSVGIRALRDFRTKLPARFIPPLFALDLIRAKLLMGRRQIQELRTLPSMSDESMIEAVRLMAAVGKAAYQIRPELCIAVLVKLVNLCLKHGNSRDCAIGYMAFGSIFLGGILGRHREGFDFGQLALDLVEEFENSEQRAEVNFVIGYFGSSWLEPATRAEELWQIAYRSGRETGDLFHAGCAAAATALSWYMRGVDLPRILEYTDEQLVFLEEATLPEPAAAIRAVRQAVLNLEGRTLGGASFTDADFSETDFVASLDKLGSRHFPHYYFVPKMHILFLRGEYEEGIKICRLASFYLKELPGMLHLAEHHYLHALLLAATSSRQGKMRRWRSHRKILRISRRFRRWAVLCPHNFADKSALIEAEFLRATSQKEKAMGEYHAAMRLASNSNHVQVEALASQRLASLHRELGEETDADHWRSVAADRYRGWGATAMVERLKMRKS